MDVEGGVGHMPRGVRSLGTWPTSSCFYKLRSSRSKDVMRDCSRSTASVSRQSEAPATKVDDGAVEAG